MFEKLKEKLGLAPKKEETAIDNLERGVISGTDLSTKDADDIVGNLKISLLEADVSLPTADKISTDLLQKIKEKRVKLKGDRSSVLREAIKTTILDIASLPQPNILEFAQKKSPYVIMLIGMNGTGKTTSAAKLSEIFKNNGFYVVMAAADTFRAGAIEQIALHGDKLGIRVVKHQAGGDPAAVSFDAIKHASKFRKSVVIIDTAGRMQTNKNLLEEMKKIKRISNPDLILLTVDALSGVDALNQAKLFDESVGVDGYIVTKIDADAKGGSILTLLSETKKPILYVGTGQGYSDLIPFSLDWYLDKLLA
jgi:fused signal recognition particle receptor